MSDSYNRHNNGCGDGKITTRVQGNFFSAMGKPLLEYKETSSPGTVGRTRRQPSRRQHAPPACFESKRHNATMPERRIATMRRATIPRCPNVNIKCSTAQM